MAKSQLEWTKNFEKFQILGWNRTLDEKRIDRLAESIKTYGFLLPIVINQDFFIVDGQHRLQAAKGLNHEMSYFQYTIENEKLPLLVADLNTTAKTWSIENYLHMWAHLKREPYVWMKSLEDSKNIFFKHLWKLVQTASGEFPAFMKKFKLGNIEFSEPQRKRIIDRIGYFNDIRTVEKRFSDFGLGFSAAAVRIVSSRTYDHSRMMEVLKKEPASLLRSRTTPEYFIQLQEMYNRGLPDKKRLQGQRRSTN